MIVDLIQNSIAFGLVQFYCFGTWEKGNWLQKARVQSLWTTNDMATARNTGTTGLFYIKFNAFSSMVTSYRFWGGLSLYMVLCTFSAQLRFFEVAYA